MPRLDQVSLSEITDDDIRKYYELLFSGRDPVSEPGTATGTPGNWWTVMALRPYLFRHATAHFGMFGMFADKSVSELDPKIRELAITRAGWARGSQFVFSQHCKAARRAGVDEDRIAAIPHWQTAEIFTPEERAVLAYADALIYDGGRVADGVFEALKSVLSDGDILELTYHVCGYNLHAVMCRALRLEYDDVPERITEVPMPESPGVQDWAGQNGAGGAWSEKD